eukprot:COSAG01_NODE_3330_length_6246_cov_4.593298_4_plen_108_part_00
MAARQPVAEAAAAAESAYISFYSCSGNSEGRAPPAPPAHARRSPEAVETHLPQPKTRVLQTSYATDQDANPDEAPVGTRALAQPRLRLEAREDHIAVRNPQPLLAHI